MADSELVTAPSIIEYPFKRTTGPVIGGFLTGLREGILVGSCAPVARVQNAAPASGRVTPDDVKVSGQAGQDLMTRLPRSPPHIWYQGDDADLG